MNEAMWILIADGLWDTLRMTLLATLFAYIGGMPIGIILTITRKGGVVENRIVNAVLGLIVNIGRSIPFLILLVMVIPLTRLIVGTSIGTEATIVPLTIGAIPLVARMVESSLMEVSGGIIEAALSMGASPRQMITHFLLPESSPSLLLGLAINLATILGYSAMAGFVAGGGIGAIAFQYGFYRYQTDVLLVTVAILVILVQIFQEAGARLSHRIRH
jgi:D-methionine transport system permease protein